MDDFLCCLFSTIYPYLQLVTAGLKIIHLFSILMGIVWTHCNCIVPTQWHCSHLFHMLIHKLLLVLIFLWWLPWCFCSRLVDLKNEFNPTSLLISSSLHGEKTHVDILSAFKSVLCNLFVFYTIFNEATWKRQASLNKAWTNTTKVQKGPSRTCVKPQTVD